MKGKVGFMIGTLSKFGGTERVTSVISNALANRDIEVEIICMFNCGESSYDLNEKIKIRYLLNRPPKGILVDYLRILVALFKCRHDFRFIVTVGMDLFIFAAPLKILYPKFSFIGWEHFNLKVRGPVVTIARRLGVLFAHKIVTITKADFQEYTKVFPRSNKISCIYNPITIDNIIPIHNYASKVVLAIGRFTHQKGFDMMLSIWSKLDSKYYDWKLILVGEGQYDPLLKDIVRKNRLEHCVSIVSPTKHIIDYYYKSSIYVLPSRYEGLPLVLLEAQAAGLPVVAFNCETGPKEVIEDGKNGFLIDTFDCDQFVRKLELLMGDTALREQMGQQALAKANTFLTEHIIDDWLKILN